MAIKGVPLYAGNLAITLSVRDAGEASDFYCRAFGAVEIARYLVPRHPRSVGPVKAVHLRIGQAVIHVATANPGDDSDALDRPCGHNHCDDESHDHDHGSPKTPEALQGFSTVITLFFPNVDVTVARAVASGAQPIQPAQDTPWGDRVAVIIDPFGHPWGLASVTAEITVEEHNRQMADLAKGARDCPRLELRQPS